MGLEVESSTPEVDSYSHTHTHTHAEHKSKTERKTPQQRQSITVCGVRPVLSLPPSPSSFFVLVSCLSPPTSVYTYRLHRLTSKARHTQTHRHPCMREGTRLCRSGHCGDGQVNERPASSPDALSELWRHVSVAPLSFFAHLLKREKEPLRPPCIATLCWTSRRVPARLLRRSLHSCFPRPLSHPLLHLHPLARLAHNSHPSLSITHTHAHTKNKHPCILMHDTQRRSRSIPYSCIQPTARFVGSCRISFPFLRSSSPLLHHLLLLAPSTPLPSHLPPSSLPYTASLVCVCVCLPLCSLLFFFICVVPCPHLLRASPFFLFLDLSSDPSPRFSFPLFSCVGSSCRTSSLSPAVSPEHHRAAASAALHLLPLALYRSTRQPPFFCVVVGVRRSHACVCVCLCFPSSLSFPSPPLSLLL